MQNTQQHIRLDSFDNVVVKVGSSLLVDAENKCLRTAWMGALCEDIAELKKRDIKVTIVSSGAIATARVMYGYETGNSLVRKRVAATRGQPRLMSEWDKAAGNLFGTSQLLVTTTELNDPIPRDILIGTLQESHKDGFVPVINENDAIAYDEIVYGDNDRLAANVAVSIGAKVVVLLSDINGLYTADPRKDSNATLIKRVTEITPEVMAMGGGPASDRSKGGMKSKLEAAQIAMAAGCATVITKGEEFYPLRGLNNGKLCTWFTP